MTEVFSNARCLQSLTEKYGEILDMSELAEVFKYETIAAVRKAHSRKTLPVKLYRFPHKNGLYAKVEDVVAAIETMELSQ
ncbi:hypothetical protein [Bermanella sp. R86510]|uniref:hypothetical protein n=1 Tax=unclassified Bermanella TaxID=2627862 RepID=UPI0037CBAFE6